MKLYVAAFVLWVALFTFAAALLSRYGWALLLFFAAGTWGSKVGTVWITPLLAKVADWRLRRVLRAWQKRRVA